MLDRRGRRTTEEGRQPVWRATVEGDRAIYPFLCSAAAVSFIHEHVGDKSYVQCAQRWRNVLKSGIKKVCALAVEPSVGSLVLGRGRAPS